jgi:hypothetical protein
MEQLQSHIWLTAFSYMGKYLRISSYIWKPFLIYGITLQRSPSNFLILYMRKIVYSPISPSSFLSPRLSGRSCTYHCAVHTSNMSATWSPACCSWRARPACLAGPFSMTMLYAPVAEQPQNKLPIARWTFLYYQNGVFIKRRRWNECSAPSEIVQKNLASCEAFGISVHSCWQTLMGSRRMEDGLILMKISAPFPLSLINNYRITPLSVDPSWTDL